MNTRRAFLLSFAVYLGAAAAGAHPEKSAPLDVTYYYLPG
jgi:hypothetical protein